MIYPVGIMTRYLVQSYKVDRYFIRQITHNHSRSVLIKLMLGLSNRASLPNNAAMMLDFLSQILKKHRHRIGVGYFLCGVCIGVALSWLVYFSSVGSDCSTTSPAGPGWSLIHVFIGNSSHIQHSSWIENRYFSAVRWFSQARQDEVVAALLKYKKGGYFIDLAANDPIKISNSYALETYYQWTGLCMEPNPAYWAGLAYRKCHVVAAVVGDRDMTEVLFKFPNAKGPMGGIVGFDNKVKTGEDRIVYTTTLKNVLQTFNTPVVIDYLSLDIEGAEDFVMKSFPFQQYQFKIITLERPSEEMKERLTKYGYKLWKYIKLSKTMESLWYHKSVENQLDFATAEKIDTTCVYRESYSESHPNCQLKGPLPESVTSIK